MHEKQMIKSKPFISESEEHFNLKYYIISSTSSSEQYKNICYGVCIEKHLNDPLWDTLIEEETVNNVTTSKDQIEYIVNRLSDNDVTPTTLINILDDLISYSILEISSIA